jgi:hypothetical protein
LEPGLLPRQSRLQLLPQGQRRRQMMLKLWRRRQTVLVLWQRRQMRRRRVALL